jgi:hypothetical protein
MTEDIRDRRDREWEVLFVKIQEALSPFGEVWDFDLEKGGYWLVDDNWGNFKHSLGLYDLALLEPVVIAALQKILDGYPDWEILVNLVPPTEDQWPEMGLIIRGDQIIDELERNYLPKEYQNLKYPGGRRSTSIFDNDA